jgi:hypothetical protein
MSARTDTTEAPGRWSKGLGWPTSLWETGSGLPVLTPAGVGCQNPDVLDEVNNVVPSGFTARSDRPDGGV